MSKENEESKEISDKERTLMVAKDLVEYALQVQKVLATASVGVSNIEEARLLVAMTNMVLDKYTKEKEKDE